MLKFPDFSKSFVLCCDASKYAVGSCLSQKDKDGFLRPVAFCGKKLLPSQVNYSTTDRESLAIKHGLEKFDHYLLSKHFDIMTDHAAGASLFDDRRPTTTIRCLLKD